MIKDKMEVKAHQISSSNWAQQLSLDIWDNNFSAQTLVKLKEKTKIQLISKLILQMNSKTAI
jgi:hypothetical protein